MSNEPLEGRIVSEPGPQPSEKGRLLIPLADGSYAEFDLNETPDHETNPQGFAEAISARYQESLWGKAPSTSITVDLENVEQALYAKHILKTKQELARRKARSARGYLLGFLPGIVLQLLIAIFVTAFRGAPAPDVLFCWALVVLEAGWTVKLYRDWRKAVAECEDPK